MLAFGLGAIPVLAQTNVIFVLDTSGSMKSGKLYDRLLRELETRYISHLQSGDTCAFLTFDTTIQRRGVVAADKVGEVAATLTSLGRIPPSGKYTFLTGAVSEAAQMVEELAREHPSKRTEIYIFTDGKNEPPPGATGPINWQQVMADKFIGETISRPDVGVYIVRLPGSPAESLGDLPSAVKVIDSPPSGPQVTASRLELVRTALDVRVTAAASSEPTPLTFSIEIEAKSVVPSGEKKRIRVLPPEGVMARPSEASFTRPGDKQTIEIGLSAAPAESRRDVRLRIEPVTENLKTDPELSITVHLDRPESKPTVSWIQRVFPALRNVVLPIGGLILLYFLIPRFGRRAKVETSAGVSYPLRRRAGLLGHSVKLGPGRGIPMGDGQPLGTFKARYGGGIKLISRKPGLKVNNADVPKGGVRLAGNEQISFGTDRLFYRRS
jgi:hypothetical protein